MGGMSSQAYFENPEEYPSYKYWHLVNNKFHWLNWQNIYYLDSIILRIIMNSLKPIGIDEVERGSRESRFHQTNALLGEIFEWPTWLDATKLQLVVSRWALYLLDNTDSAHGKRKVILSSDGRSWYFVDLNDEIIRVTKSWNGIRVRRVFDITENTLEAALAVVLANRYSSLREEQIKLQERELLGKYGYMISKREEYPDFIRWEERLAA